MEIQTQRFLLRDYIVEDIDEFAAYHADKRSQEYYPPATDEMPTPEELVRLFMAWASTEPRLNYQLAVIHRKPPHELVGCGGVRCADTEAGSGELGIELAPQFWSHPGYAVEVLHALAEFAFDRLSLQQVFGNAIDANNRLGRLVDALGATSQPVATPSWMVEKGWTQVRWQLTADAWCDSSSKLINWIRKK